MQIYKCNEIFNQLNEGFFYEIRADSHFTAMENKRLCVRPSYSG